MSEKASEKVSENLETLSIPLKSASIPNEVKDRKAAIDNSFDYIPFGSDNLFPQVWELQMRNSVVSRSIIKDKVTYTMGDGLVFADDEKLKNYAMMVNSFGQSLEDVLALIYRDKYSGGNAYIEIVKKDGFVSFFHKDWTECRIKKEGNKIIVHPDWFDYDNTKNVSVHIPIYPEFGVVKESQETGAEDLEGERSICHIKNYEAEFNFYGLPDAIAAKNAIAIGYASTAWNKSRMENGMNISGILMLSGKYSDPQAKKVKQDVQDAFTGQDNQGKVFTIVKESGTDGRTENTEFLQVGTQSDGDWLNLSNDAKGEMLMSFNWKRSLTGFDDNTGFDTNRILNEYYVALATVIIPEQRIILGKLQQVISMQTDFDGSLITHINKPPVPLFMILKNPDQAFRVGEARESAGFEFDENDKDHLEYMSSSNTNNTTNNTNNGTSNS